MGVSARCAAKILRDLGPSWVITGLYRTAILMTASPRSADIVRRSAAPIYLSFTLHCRRVRILRFDPVAAASRDVVRVLALRDDALKPKLASMLKDYRAVFLDMLIEANTQQPPPNQHVEGGP